MSAHQEPIKQGIISDKKTMLALLKQNANNLQRGSDNLKDDPEIVTFAMIQDRMALRHASNRLKKDPDLNDIAFMSGKNMRALYRDKYLAKFSGQNISSTHGTLFHQPVTNSERQNQENECQEKGSPRGFVD